MKEITVIEQKEQEMKDKQFALRTEIEALTKEKKNVPSILLIEDNKLENMRGSLRSNKFKIEAKIKDMNNALTYTTGSILVTSAKVKEDVFLSKNIERQESKNVTIPLLELQIILNDTVYKYFLPMLFGLLGACVHILRKLSLQIETLTFTSANSVKFKLRLYLGTIAGLSFSWLFPVMDVNSVFAASPLAVAFIVGYSIEVLFLALDKLINILNKNNDETGKLK